MKNIFLIAIFTTFVCAEVLNIENFESDLYSRDKSNSIQKVNVNLRVSGRDVFDNEPYILDSLNVVIGSFYVEDLLTSLGKEKFKETLVKYALKKHSIDIEEVLIISLKVIREPKIDELIQALRESKTAKNEPKMSQKEQVEEILKGNKIQLKPLDLNQIDNFGEDFTQK
ncbi:MAG: hypothetical protein ACTTJC_00945 [Campylobacter sp.]